MKENLYTPDCIRTYTGLYMNVFEPTVDMIDIRDIAHGLSHQCRFAGQIETFYSVAQHSVRASEKFSDWYPSLNALLHDAAEAYLSDIPSPIKVRLPEYVRLEENLMSVIYKKFGLTWPLLPVIKEIDKELLEWEWEHIVLERKAPVNYWSPRYAEGQFMDRFNNLTS